MTAICVRPEAPSGSSSRTCKPSCSMDHVTVVSGVRRTDAALEAWPSPTSLPSGARHRRYSADFVDPGRGTALPSGWGPSAPWPAVICRRAGPRGDRPTTSERYTSSVPGRQRIHRAALAAIRERPTAIALPDRFPPLSRHHPAPAGGLTVHHELFREYISTNFDRCCPSHPTAHLALIGVHRRGHRPNLDSRDVVCAVGREGTDYVFTPFGHLVDGNPYAAYLPPAETLPGPSPT